MSDTQAPRRAPARPAAVLWDMDGTLVDTEPYWIAGEYELVAEHGGTWSEDHAHAIVGHGPARRRGIHQRARPGGPADRRHRQPPARRRDPAGARTGAVAARGARAAGRAAARRRAVRAGDDVVAALRRGRGRGPAGRLVRRGDRRRRGDQRQATSRAVHHRSRPARRRHRRLRGAGGLAHRAALGRRRRLPGVRRAQRRAHRAGPGVHPARLAHRDRRRRPRCAPCGCHAASPAAVGRRGDRRDRRAHRRGRGDRHPRRQHRRSPAARHRTRRLGAVLGARRRRPERRRARHVAARGVAVLVPRHGGDDDRRRRERAGRRRGAVRRHRSRAGRGDRARRSLDGLEPGQMAALLADPTQRSAHVDAIVAFVEQGGYAGVDLDYESFAFKDGRSTWSTTRPNWVAFLDRAERRALHADGKTLTVSVPPIRDDGGETDRGYWVYDYAAMGDVRRPHPDHGLRLLDGIRSRPDGPAGVRPRGDRRRQARRRRRRQVGPRRTARGVQLADVAPTAPAPPASTPGSRRSTSRPSTTCSPGAQATPERDPTTGEATFTYTATFTDGTDSCTQTREAHYVDAEGAAARVDLARTSRLGGAALWAIGYDSPSTWTAIGALARPENGTGTLPAASEPTSVPPASAPTSP